MSREVISAVIRGAQAFVSEAEKDLAAAIKEKGEDCEVAFPETGFFLPMAYSLMGVEAKKLGDLKQIARHCREQTPETPSESRWLPYLGDGLDAGAATLLSQEIICALRYLNGESVEEGFTGFISDTVLRELGIQLVDGRMPGFAAILGPAPTNDIAAKVVRDLQKRSIMTFLVANRDGRSMFDQLTEEGIEMGWNTYIVPVGRDTMSSIYVLN